MSSDDEINNKIKKARKNKDYLDELKKIEILDVIVDNIEYYRKIYKISKFNLSNEAQIGKNTIYEITKKQYMPSVYILHKISKSLGIPIELLFIPKDVDEYKPIIELIIKVHKINI